MSEDQATTDIVAAADTAEAAVVGAIGAAATIIPDGTPAGKLVQHADRIAEVFDKFYHQATADVIELIAAFHAFQSILHRHAGIEAPPQPVPETDQAA